MNPQVAAVIVHDLKNALGALDGELRRMIDEPTRPLAVQAQQTCAALRDKLIGFLTLYKASSQGLSPRIDAVNPEDFLQALVREQVAGKPGLTVSVELCDMPPLGFFDEHLVGLALEAALQNATRFARSAITLACVKEASGDLAFVIRDDGPGLGATEASPSTGLGMSLCEAIAQAHRNGDRAGSVSLDNGADGGAVFTMRLP